MSETIGRLLAAGNVAEVFEWGSRVVKLYRSPARKPTAFREAAIRRTAIVSWPTENPRSVEPGD